jgi:hypothetical protein
MNAEGYAGAPAQPPASEAAPLRLDAPVSRRRELWLLMRAVRDFLGGFRRLQFAGPCVTVFGSARCDEAHPYYAVGRDVGRRLAQAGFTVMTGGGPGLMEAVNRGAKEAGGRSVSCNIRLPMEQRANPYVDQSFTCQHFFVRKVLLFKYSYAFIALPGGYGTMDELFEALTLVQTRKIEGFPIVLIGTEYWRSTLAVMRQMADETMIDREDLDLVLVTDDLDEAMSHIRRECIHRFGLCGPGIAQPAASAESLSASPHARPSHVIGS